MSPLIGFVLALFLVLLVSWIFVRQTPFAVDSTFRILQFVSASLYSLGHGGNDAQKTMGIIAVLLYLARTPRPEFHVPLWVVLVLPGGDGARHAVRRLAHRAHDGLEDYAAQPDAGLLRRDRRSDDAVRGDRAWHSGFDDAHDHRCDHRRRRRAPRFGRALGRRGNIVVAWVITMPAAALISALTYFLAGLIG